MNGASTERGIHLWMGPLGATGPSTVNGTCLLDLHPWNSFTQLNQTSFCEWVLQIWSGPLVNGTCTKGLQHENGTCTCEKFLYVETELLMWTGPPLMNATYEWWVGCYLHLWMSFHMWAGPVCVNGTCIHVWTAPARVNRVCVTCCELDLHMWMRPPPGWVVNVWAGHTRGVVVVWEWKKKYALVNKENG